MANWKRPFGRKSDRSGQDAPDADAQDAPRLARTIEEETEETLAVLELSYLPREEKRARERAAYAGEIEFHEKEVARKRRETRVEIQRAVDQLVTLHRTTEAPETPAPPPPEATPEPPASEPEPEPAPRVEAPPPAQAPPVPPARFEVTPEQRAAIAERVPGSLIGIDLAYETGKSQVVEARYENEDGTRGASLFAIVDGDLRDLDRVRETADAVVPKRAPPTPASAPETPAPPAPAPETPARAAPEPAPDKPAQSEDSTADEQAAVKPKKRGFNLGGKLKEAAAEALALDAPPKAPKEKKRFGLGKRDAPESSTQEEASATDAPQAQDEAAGKRKLSLPFGKKKTAAQPATDAKALDESVDDAIEKKSKKRFGLPRIGKKDEPAHSGTPAPATEADAAAPDAAPGKSRFKMPFGKKDKSLAGTEDEPAAPDEEAPAGEGKRAKFRMPFKKKDG